MVLDQQTTQNAVKIAVISASLKPKSRSRILVNAVSERLQEHGVLVHPIRLEQETLPFCDGSNCYQNPRVQELNQELAECDAIVVGSPVYNYDLNAAVKNLLELTGNSWKKKAVAFVLAAGGPGSYLSPTSFANSLWLDHHCFLYPHFVYGLGRDFEEERIVSEELLHRIDSLASGFIRFVQAVRPLSTS